MGGTDDLAALSVKQLRKRADELHVSRACIDAARDGDDPRHDLIALIRSAGAAVQRHRNPSCTLDDLELGAAPARQPTRVVGDAEPAKFAAQSFGCNKLLAVVAVLALLIAAAGLALTVGLAVMPDWLPLTTATGREVDLLQAEVTSQQAELTSQQADSTRQQAELDAAAQTI
eukprot:COSAG06_NODE_15119_length_1096_cov_1.498495_1_plen_172_part_01